MEISDYLSLLNSLRESALGIWANFLTVSLAIVAFVGSVKTLDIRGIVLLCILFSVFSFTNHIGLEKNFNLRIEVKNTIEKQFNDIQLIEQDGLKFKKDYANNKIIIDKYTSDKEWNNEKLSFHTLISYSVPALIILYYWIGHWLTISSSGRKKHAA